MRNLLCALCLLVLVSAHVRAYEISSITDTNMAVYVPLTGSSNEPGWVSLGDENGTDMFTPGTLKKAVDYFNWGMGFMWLTRSGGVYEREDSYYTNAVIPYERACLYYTNSPVLSDDIGLSAEIRIGPCTGPGTGGMAFSWIEVPFEGETAAVFTNKMLGGFGCFLGAPRATNSTEGVGYNAGVRGYSLQFSIISNGTADGVTQMAECKNLADWTTVPGSLSTGQCVAGAWIKFKLSQSMMGTSGKFSLAWGPGFTNASTWYIPDYTNVPVYLGVSAATGPNGSHHDIRRLALYGTFVPEPTSVVAVLAFLALARRKR